MPAARNTMTKPMPVLALAALTLMAAIGCQQQGRPRQITARRPPSTRRLPNSTQHPPEQYGPHRVEPRYEG